MYSMLCSSYQTQNDYIKKCKDLCNKIMGKTTDYNNTMQLATQDQEKIEELKEKAEQKLSATSQAKVAEEEMKQMVTELKGEITGLKRKLKEPCELPEDKTLHDLQEEAEEHMKI